MKQLSMLIVAISLLSGSVLFAQGDDSCNAFTTKKQCHKESKGNCKWLESKEICKSKAAIVSEKEDGEKNLKRRKKGGDD